MKTLIAQLNYVARELAEGGLSPLKAINKAAADFMLTEVAEQDSCRIYEAADGTLINCWIEGVASDQIGDGGLGFDDQVTWFMDDLITQAEAAKIAGFEKVQHINNAIQTGRLRGYKNLNPKYQRQGATLVSEREVRERWGK